MTKLVGLRTLDISQELLLTGFERRIDSNFVVDKTGEFPLVEGCFQNLTYAELPYEGYDTPIMTSWELDIYVETWRIFAFLIH